MLDLSNLSPQPQAASFVRDTDDARAEQDIFEASMQAPVAVLFYTTGSAISKQMSATLEKLVSARVSLVRVNVTTSPGLAQALRIQTVPTVYAIYQGKPVDGFVGSRPEPELRAFIAKLEKLAGGAAAEDTAAQVRKLMAEGDDFFRQGKIDEAMASYGAVLDVAPEDMAGLGGIGWCLLEQGDAESVRAMLADLTPEQKAEPRLKGLEYVLSLGDEKPADLIDKLVAELKKNREGGAKEKLLALFDALGPAHPLTGAGRRKLSAVLFS